MMANILEKISGVKRERLVEDIKKAPLELLVEKACLMRPPMDFLKTFDGPDSQNNCRSKKSISFQRNIQAGFQPGMACRGIRGGRGVCRICSDGGELLSRERRGS